jgi:hypothetical protein
MVQEETTHFAKLSPLNVSPNGQCSRDCLPEWLLNVFQFDELNPKQPPKLGTCSQMDSETVNPIHQIKFQIVH